MGRDVRQRPKRLAEKLFQIRNTLGLSQNEIIDHLGFKDRIDRETISNYERDRREPDSLVLLAYARSAGVWADVLIDDNLYLPDNINKQRDFPKGIIYDGPPIEMLAKIFLRLNIVSDRKSTIAEVNLRKNIETLFLRKYKYEKVHDNEYKLEILYFDHDDLNRQIVIEIMQNIFGEAFKHDCSVKWEAREEGTTLHW